MKRCINSPQGTPEDREWVEGSNAIEKIVIGPSPSPSKLGAGDPVPVLEWPDDFTEKFPNLKYLHLWNVSGITHLPKLPEGLRCLDARDCRELAEFQNLPRSLESLILNGCGQLRRVPWLGLNDPTALTELLLAGCNGLPEAWIIDVIHASPELRRIDASGLHQLVNLECVRWPVGLDRLDLNHCERLERLPRNWPPRLRRLGLRRATALRELVGLPPSLDYIDLAYTESLKRLAAFAGEPRTLFLYGSGMSFNADLFGEDDETNVARAVLVDQRERARDTREKVFDDELKVILLGNGRCGKSSLARRWVDDEFDREEKSTHGVRHWFKQVDFKSVEGNEGEADVHIWDFAGQDIYHRIHRLFLQNRAIFVLCYTGHDDGADEETDQSESKSNDEEDVRRGLEYWKEQVRSLGKVPGLDIEPPVIIVRTKVDRDVTNPARATPDSNAGELAIDFSAQSSVGLDELRRAISRNVSILLGTEERRSIPSTVAAVKERLQVLTERNLSEYQEAERTKRQARSPHPTMTRSEFDALVHEELSEGEYRKDPGLLLNRFHAAGLLFYDARRLPDAIILDQFWVIEAIYAFANRESETNIRERLSLWHGKIRRSDLSRLVWDRLNYEPTEQALILELMRACGMMFTLLEPSEFRSEQLYAIPGFFPSHNDMVQLVELSDNQADAGDTWNGVELRWVTEEDMGAILGWIGGRWSRSATLWRWGASFRARDTNSALTLNWECDEPSEDYYGRLSLSFHGPEDREFESIIRNAIRNILGSKKYRDEHALDLEWPTISGSTLVPSLAATPFGGDSEDRLKSKTGSHAEAEGIRITFSFAGADTDNPGIDAAPKELARRLDRTVVRSRRIHVEVYTDSKGDENLASFIKSLADGDLVIIFWSRKYWKSEYCMAEMMYIYESSPTGCLQDHRVRVYSIGGARLGRHGAIDDSEWEGRWVQVATRRDAAAEQKFEYHPDRLRKKNAYLKREAVNDWFLFILDQERFEPFVRYLVQYRFAIDVPSSLVRESLSSWADGTLPNVFALLEGKTDLVEEREWSSAVDCEKEDI